MKAKQPALSLFPFKVIAKLERTQSNAQQNKQEPQQPIGNTKQQINNNKTTALERTAA